MIGTKTVLVLTAITGPWALLQVQMTAASHPTILSEDSLLPVGIVIALLAAVWKAARELERLNSRLKRLEDHLQIKDD